MMSKEEYLKKLKYAFGDFVFYPEDHHYEYKGEQIGISVTRLIEEYAQEFNAEVIAERVATKEGRSVQDVLEEWEYKNDFSVHKGSTCHEYVQAKWELKYYEPDYFDHSIEYFEAVEKIKKQADKFKSDYKDKLELIANEEIIGSTDYDIASAVDSLFINKQTGGLVLVDYKTNSDIHKNEKYAKNMQVPLNHLKDDSITHYAIQISIYKYLIEKYAELKVDEWFIVWFSENNEEYQIINVPYLKNEVQEILERREWGL